MVTLPQRSCFLGLSDPSKPVKGLWQPQAVGRELSRSHSLPSLETETGSLPNLLLLLSSQPWKGAAEMQSESDQSVREEAVFKVQ